MTTLAVQLGLFFGLSFAGLYLIWKIAKTKGYGVYGLFDLYILSLIFAFLFSRLGYMIVHFQHYLDAGFSIFPFYTVDGIRIWIEQLPWSYFRFWEGLDILSFLFAPGLFIVFYVLVKKEKNRSFRDVLSFPYVFLTLLLLFLFVLYQRSGSRVVFYPNNDLLGSLYLVALFIIFIISCLVLFKYFKEKKDSNISGALNFFLLGMFFLIANFFWPEGTELLAKVYWITLSIFIVAVSVYRLIPFILDEKDEDEEALRLRKLRNTMFPNKDIAELENEIGQTEGGQKTKGRLRDFRFNMRYTSLKREPITEKIIGRLLTIYYKIRRKV